MLLVVPVTYQALLIYLIVAVPPLLIVNAVTAAKLETSISTEPLVAIIIDSLPIEPSAIVTGAE